MANQNPSTESSRPSPVETERTGSRAADVATSAVLGGAAAGVVVGTIAGPIGAAVGAVVGAVAAGLAGNAIDASIDKEIEEAHWKESYAQRPYVRADDSYDDFGPAYGYGVKTFILYPGRTFEDLDEALSGNWTAARGASRLDWDRARPAAKDAWYRLGELERRRAEVAQGSDERA